MKNKLLFLSLVLFTLHGSLAGQNLVTRSLFESNERVQSREIIRSVIEPSAVINIKNQFDFDIIEYSIAEKIHQGLLSIELRFSPGRYYYSNGHISLSNLSIPELSLSIVGNDAILIAEGVDYNLRKPLFSKYHQTRFIQPFPYEDVFLDKSLNPLSFSSGIHQTDSLLHVVDEKEMICKIHTSEANRFKKGKHIIVTTWFTAVNGPIIKIEDGWIYFKSSKLQYNDNYKCYNINYDYGYAKRLPRFIVFNASNNCELFVSRGNLNSTTGVRKIHQCSASSFLVAENTKIKELKIDGLSFVGSSAGEPLFSFISSDIKQVGIANSTFKHLRNRAIEVVGTDNVSVSGCHFIGCYGTCVYSENGSKDTRITNCVFKGNGLDYTQNHTVWCLGENYYIANNVFSNFSYAAIRTGVQPWDKKYGPCSGIIEYNELFYDKDYYDSYLENTLMDSGAIYVSTKNDNTIIRYNYIHDYIGLKDNRGIFCDTGTQNTIIYGNLILNVPNSNAIEIWRVEVSEKWEPNANDGNAVFQNILGGKYRFDGKKNAKKNIQGLNYIIYYGNKPNVQKNELNKTEDDTFILIEGPQTAEKILNHESIRRSLIYSKLRSFIIN